ncbi:hypothetical protein ACFQ1Q_02055 [Winogradskyella litorisediminis]|uniref:Uncharacterized protein n=1 Tax=Winogradskyella litorisediminis TaxID=1156618 RepID=A0ABW3N6C8_9FLAO
MKKLFITSILSLFLAASITSCREKTTVVEKEVEAPKEKGNSVKIKTEGFELEVDDNK